MMLFRDITEVNSTMVIGHGVNTFRIGVLANEFKCLARCKVFTGMTAAILRRAICGSVLQSSSGMTARCLRRAGLSPPPFKTELLGHAVPSSKKEDLCRWQREQGPGK